MNHHLNLRAALILALSAVMFLFLAATLSAKNGTGNGRFTQNRTFYQPIPPSQTPTKTATPNATATVTLTPSATMTPTATITPTATLSVTLTATPSATVTASPTPTTSPTPIFVNSLLPVILYEQPPSPTPTATPTATAVPCSNAIINGGFENNDAWIIGNNVFPAGYSSQIVHSGQHAMRVGIVNPIDNVYSYSSIWQFVTIPANIQSAALNFWLYPGSSGTQSAARLSPPLQIPTHELEGSLSTDAQMVIVFDQANQQYTLIFQRSNSQSWTPYSFDLSPFAGQTLKIYFGVFNNGWGGVTGMFVDDVTLEMCNS